MIMGNKYRCRIPILLVGFNRPDNISKVLDKIRDVKPYKLYVAIDGPRENITNDVPLVEKTISIVSNIDWDCDVYYKFNKQNCGAEVTISSAIRWICKNEEYFIMLEDDIVAPISFFKFQEEMLIKYKNSSHIKLVSGNNFTPIPTPNGEDYFFSEYGHTWGWGSWSRVWRDFSLNIEIPKEHCTLKFCKSITNTIEEAKHLQRVYKSLRKQGVGNCTWDYISSYKSKINRMLSIVPSCNLSTNIGIFGLHSNGQTKFHYVSSNEAFTVKKHPTEIKCWKEYDIYHFNNHYPKRKNICIRTIYYFKRILSKIKHILLNSF